jgi:hypothetical protein
VRDKLGKRQSRWGLVHVGAKHAALCVPTRLCAGDKLVDWNDSFRLFLVSRSPAALAELPPDAAPLVTVANFTVTRGGLEGESRSIAPRCLRILHCSSWRLLPRRAGVLQTVTTHLPGACTMEPVSPKPNSRPAARHGVEKRAARAGGAKGCADRAGEVLKKQSTLQLPVAVVGALRCSRTHTLSNPHPPRSPIQLQGHAHS